MFIKKNPVWVYKGKTVRQVVEELCTFESLDLEVRISIDYGNNQLPLNFLKRKNEYYLVFNNEKKREKSSQKYSKNKSCEKKIWQLIEELRLLDSQDLEVRICISYEDDHKPISLIEKKGNSCLLTSCSDFYDRNNNQ